MDFRECTAILLTPVSVTKNLLSVQQLLEALTAKTFSSCPINNPYAAARWAEENFFFIRCAIDTAIFALQAGISLLEELQQDVGAG